MTHSSHAASEGSWFAQLFAAKIPAGLLDSSLSSLGTFVIGLAAVRYLALDDLGAYALAYSAFLLGSAIPAMLLFTPAEVQALAEREGEERLCIVRRSLRLGLPVAAAAGALVGVATLVIPTTAPLQARVAFALSLVAVCALSPAQDHLRRVLHMAGLSWAAARTSALQLATIVTGVSVLVTLGAADSPYVPFGLLAACNVVSSMYALTVCRRGPGSAADLTLRKVPRQGLSLVIGSVAQFSAGFFIVAVITAAAGPAAAARLEAVRLLAQPVSVVIVGVLAVVGPRIMSSAIAGDAVAVRRQTRRCLQLAMSIAVPYALLLSVPWDDSPLRLLVPRAFDVEYLLAGMVLAQTIGYTVGAYRMVPVALRRAGLVLRIDLLTAALGVGLVLVLAEHGPWAAVIAFGTGGILEIVLFIRCHRALLGPPAASPAHTGPG